MDGQRRSVAKLLGARPQDDAQADDLLRLVPRLYRISGQCRSAYLVLEDHYFWRAGYSRGFDLRRFRRRGCVLRRFDELELYHGRIGIDQRNAVRHRDLAGIGMAQRRLDRSGSLVVAGAGDAVEAGPGVHGYETLHQRRLTDTRRRQSGGEITLPPSMEN